jgi:hypothetical protein
MARLILHSGMTAALCHGAITMSLEITFGSEMCGEATGHCLRVTKHSEPR